MVGQTALANVQKYYPQVTKIRDARRSVRIQVTSEDSKYSKKKSPNHCALAKACEKRYDGAIISLAIAYLIRGNKARRYRVPSSISRELVSFDRHHDFRPGEYTLHAPSSNERLEARRESRLRRKKPKYKLKPTKRHHTQGIRSL